MVVDQEKLKKLQAQAAASKGSSGKGAPRRKAVRVGATTSAADDKKLSTALKKLNVQPIAGVEECNMFMDNGNVLHFSAPKVHAAVTNNTYAIYGHGQEKELTELVPGILNQLGPDSLNSLRKMAESYNAGRAMAGGKEKEPDDDDDVPNLVESFEVSDDKSADAAPADASTNKLEELE